MPVPSMATCVAVVVRRANNSAAGARTVRDSQTDGSRTAELISLVYRNNPVGGYLVVGRGSHASRHATMAITTPMVTSRIRHVRGWAIQADISRAP